MNKHFSLIIALLIIFSCSERESMEGKEGVIHLNIDELKKSRLSEVFDRIEYKQLDLPENVFLQQVDKVIIQNGKIYILDYSKSKILYILDDSWKYITHIKRIGQGPGEYLSPLDFTIWGDQIEILDVTNKVLFFNNQGEFQKEMKLPFNTNKFCKISDSEYLLYTKESSANHGENPNCELVQYNIQTDEFRCLLERPSYQVPFSVERNVIAESNSQTLFSKIYSDTIYSISANGSNPEYVLNFGKNALPKELIDPKKSSLIQILQVLNNSDQAYHSPGLFLSDNRMATQFKAKGRNYLFFNKKENTIKLLESGSKNDIDGGMPFYGLDIVTEDYVGILIFPEYLNRAFEKFDKKEAGKYPDTFIKFTENLDPEGPMVFLKYYFN